MSQPTRFDAVSVVTKANVYFDGKVVSHTVLFDDQSKKTLGLIYPGSYHFGTSEPERMDIVAGQCTVVLDGETPSVLQALDQWIRRRLRSVIWKQWKRGKVRFAKLYALGVNKDLAAKTAELLMAHGI